MTTRHYYSVRTGKNSMGAAIDFSTLCTLFRDAVGVWEKEGYLQEHFGYYCVDDGRVPGSLGEDAAASMHFKLRKQDLWPIDKHIEHYTEDDLFDVIEFVFDHISKPLEG